MFVVTSRAFTDKVLQYRDGRLNVVTGGSVGSELAPMKRVLDTAVKKWGYGIPYNPINDIKYPKGSVARTRRLAENEFEVIAYRIHQ